MRDIEVPRRNAMNKHQGARAALLTAGLALLGSGVALAQTATETRPSAQSNAHPETGTQGSGDERPQIVAPVLRIVSVEVLRSSHGTPLDIIRVRGLASTPGWGEGERVPLTRGTPKDGILELIFVARAPAEAVEAVGFEPIEGIFPLGASHPYKGIHAHSARDPVLL